MSGYCVICLNNVGVSEYGCKKYFNCKCFDNFHNDCIYLWMKKQNTMCPLCRTELNYSIIFERRRVIGVCIVVFIFMSSTILVLVYIVDYLKLRTP